MRKVIGKSLSDEMVLLQSPESVLKNRVIWTCLHGVKQFGEVRSLLSSDAQQMLGRIEEERLLRFANDGFGSFRHAPGRKHYAAARLSAHLRSAQLTDAPLANLLLPVSPGSSRMSQTSPIRLAAQR